MLNTQKYKYNSKQQMEDSYNLIDKQLKEKYLDSVNNNHIAVAKDPSRTEIRIYYDPVVLNEIIKLKIPYYKGIDNGYYYMILSKEEL